MALGFVAGISRNYPDLVATFNPCTESGCDGAGRGVGPCAQCYEKRLAGVVGPALAAHMHDTIRTRSVVLDKVILAARNKTKEGV